MPAREDLFVATLIERLSDPAFDVRVHAGVLLSEMGAKADQALPRLRELLKADDVRDRRLAALTLGSLVREVAEALPSLLYALHDEDETVRRLAAEALQKTPSSAVRVQAA
ncbi:MAG TPA: hypothetical protein VN688_20780 [Gemmataceae bacterium]|nr:hypothetical protein [Gemmataceae bacterium]